MVQLHSLHCPRQPLLLLRGPKPSLSLPQHSPLSRFCRTAEHGSPDVLVLESSHQNSPRIEGVVCRGGWSSPSQEMPREGACSPAAPGQGHEPSLKSCPRQGSCSENTGNRQGVAMDQLPVRGQWEYRSRPRGSERTCYSNARLWALPCQWTGK